MLKKIVFICSLLLAVSQSAYSQFQIGANLGAVVSSTNLDLQGRSVSSLAGFYPELQAGYRFNDYFATNLGLGYTQKGFKEQPLGEGESRVRANFFSIPVYADVHLPIGEKFSAGAIAGLQFNIFNSISAPAPYNIDYQQMHNPVGLLCGVQLGYNLQEDLQLHLQYRFESDFVYADDNERLGRMHENLFLVGLTYVIDFAREVYPSADAVVW